MEGQENPALSKRCYKRSAYANFHHSKQVEDSGLNLDQLKTKQIIITDLLSSCLSFRCLRVPQSRGP